jgi:hypothetical protein
MYAGLVLQESTLQGVLLVTNVSNTPVDADALPTFRVYGPDVNNEESYLVSGTCAFLDSGSISNASNATPIVITSAAHGLTTGSRVTIAGINGNPAANGTFVVTVIDANTFSIPATGSGVYASGGTWHATGAYNYSVPAIGANGFNAGSNYQVLFNYALSSVQQGQLDTFGCI